MKYKLNGLGNVDRLSTQKEIITTAMELIGDVNIVTETDIKLSLMLAFVIVLENEHKVMEDLNNSDNIQINVITDVEPAFYDIILKDEKATEIYQILLKDLIKYYDEKRKYSSSSIGFLSSFFEELQTLTKDDIIKIIKSFKDTLIPKIEESKEIKDDKELKKEAMEDVNELKMKALIEKYQRIEG